MRQRTEYFSITHTRKTNKIFFRFGEKAVFTVKYLKLVKIHENVKSIEDRVCFLMCLFHLYKEILFCVYYSSLTGQKKKYYLFLEGKFIQRAGKSIYHRQLQFMWGILYIYIGKWLVEEEGRWWGRYCGFDILVQCESTHFCLFCVNINTMLLPVRQMYGSDVSNWRVHM